MKRGRFLLFMFLLAAALLAAILLSLGVGAVRIPPREVFGILFLGTGSESDAVIVRDLRLPRVLLAALIGGGLAAAGAAFQGLFRNPLADPFVVGASGGASLGATVAITAGLTGSFAGFGPVPLAAFAGAMLAVLLVYSIAQVGGGASGVELLLAGAAMSTLLSAVVSLLMLMGHETLHEVFAWTMGSLSGRGWPHLASSAPWILAGTAMLALLARPLDALSCGERTAQGLGLSLGRSRAAVVGSASLATAAAVAAGGVIGFVGLIAPHMARLLFGTAHGRLIPASTLLGMLLLVLADDLARTVLAPTELPVGLLTSLIGGVFFLYLLKTRRQRLRED